MRKNGKSREGEWFGGKEECQSTSSLRKEPEIPLKLSLETYWQSVDETSMYMSSSSFIRFLCSRKVFLNVAVKSKREKNCLKWKRVALEGRLSIRIHTDHFRERYFSAVLFWQNPRIYRALQLFHVLVQLDRET